MQTKQTGDPIQVRNFLGELRKARGLSVAELASTVGVSRQTIYAIEEGGFVPNTAVALRLAEFLGVTIEQIFSLDRAMLAPTLEAELLDPKRDSIEEGQMARLCRVHRRMIAVSVPSFPAYLPIADGIVSKKLGSRVAITSALPPAPGDGPLLLAGCDPALSLLSEVLNRSGMEVVGVPRSSRRALELLKGNRVHAAGSHLLDAATGTYNVPIVQRLFPRNSVAMVTFAIWEQGLVLRRGNPKNLRDIPDLAHRGVTLINREKGSGSRNLLDKALRKAGIETKNISGYDNEAKGHLAAAYSVATGGADCCIATQSAARCFGLSFQPLAVERFDLFFSRATLELPVAKALLDLLNRASFKRKLENIAGYDTAHTGQVLT